MIKKVSFIEARSPGVHVFSKFPIPRLGSLQLSTILKELGYEVKVFIEDIAEVDWSYVEDSDIVCISTITPTAIRAYEIGDRLRALGIPVVMGGAHPTFMAEEALQHADYVIKGEGETGLPKLLQYLNRGTPSLSDIEGLSYIDRTGKVYHNPVAPLIEDLDTLPMPDYSLVHGWTKSNVYALYTSRGCPYNCKFCSVIQMFGRKYRHKSVEKTLEELRFAAKINKSVKFIVDDNFAANKKRTKEILRALIEEKVKLRWSAQVRVEVAKDPELLRLMADSGCYNLYIGFESVNPDTLKAFNKSQDLNDIVECIKKVKDHGIHIHGMFVLGADTDTVDTVRKTSEFASDLGIDTVQFVMLTPLPGTPFFYEMQQDDRLIHTAWSKYDAHHVVFLPKNMTPLELQIETIKAMARFYSWGYVMKNIVRFEPFYAAIGVFAKRAIKTAMEEIQQYLENFNIPSMGSFQPS